MILNLQLETSNYLIYSIIKVKENISFIIDIINKIILYKL